MEGPEVIKRRQFIKTAVAAGTVTGLAAGTAEAHKPALRTRYNLKPDLLRVGMVGLGPYSHAMAYTQAINEPELPPRTNMEVVAVWGREDGYLSSFKGSDTWKQKRMAELGNYMSIEKFKNTLGVQNIVKDYEKMVKLVDAVFIMDPPDALNLARPFIEARKPVFINRPVAWNIKDAREIVRLAKEYDCPLITGSCVPWMNEFQVAKSRIDPEKVQHYYIDGSTANFGSYMPHILETAQMLVGGKVIRCSTHGVTWPADEDPLSIPPVMTHLEYEKTADDREAVIGVASTWFGQPYRNWAKVHLDRDVVEQGVFWEGDRGVDHDEHLWLPFLRVIGRTFETDRSPEDGDYILNKVSTMLMAHKSGAEGGRPVGIDEIESHSLPRYETEKA
ncbi:MAG: Gfo/Idh/MocA family oxidoreductase [Candidatus Latescibacteria bacterium]|nr:Gfo/Idh/MocA family oxidoreductase [Candidatus Latescibacterota bacterium]